MKKKELFQSLKVIALALILAVGVSYATGAWEDASGTPPENNAPRPINVSDEAQTKAGDLYIENGSGSALLVGDLLAVWGTSTFNDDVNLGMAGGADEDIDLYVSGAIRNEDLVVGGMTYPAQVCASADGTLVGCDAAEPASFYESNIVMITSGDISASQGWLSCLNVAEHPEVAGHPHIIGGGGNCYNDGVPDSKIVRSQPSRSGSVHWTNLDESDEIPYSWYVQCNNSADIVNIYAFCSS